jgi:peptidyl-prolyl cis-trans isomerase C
LTEEQLKAMENKLRKDILRDSYLEHKGLLNPKIDEQTLRRFYDENRQSFQESRSVKASHILIRLPKTPTADQELEAQDKARKILADLKQGKDFALLAIQSSDCSSRENGGSLGFIKQGFMPKEFDSVAFKLKPGETSDIVKTRHGLHIIQVEESKPQTIKEYDEVKEYIAGYLKNDYQRRKVDELVNELRKKASVEVLLN